MSFSLMILKRRRNARFIRLKVAERKTGATASTAIADLLQNVDTIATDSGFAAATTPFAPTAAHHTD